MGIRAATVLIATVAMVVGTAPAPVAAQSYESLPIELADGERLTVPVVRHRGYAAFAAGALEPLGWRVLPDANRTEAVLRHSVGVDLVLTSGSPFIRWNGLRLQLVHPPYWFGETLQLPIQVLVEVLPGGLPESYRFDEERYVLEVTGVSFAPPPDIVPEAGVASASPPPSSPPVERPGLPPPSLDDASNPSAPRIVVIDPGHGGSDPGAVGPGGVREKDVALALALALARELSRDSDLDVRLTRDADVAVPLWSRGEWATEWKGDRPGVFISIHANALAERPGVRGFETYFLSEARDESERRVAALENASLVSAASGTDPGDAADPLLGSILQDLAAFDHQHWSADFGRQVQDELGRFHPGTDRGVKQGPFAVITNSLMPSVLVEVGFLTNPEEERLLSRPEFHRDAAQALARAVREFFLSYPPGQVQ